MDTSLHKMLQALFEAMYDKADLFDIGPSQSYSNEDKDC